jgi:hypothetical protein
MRPIALSKKPRAYIPKEFRDEENPPEFTLRSISRREMLQIQANHPQRLSVTDDLAKIQVALASIEGKKPDEITEEDLSVLSGLDLTPMVQASLNTLNIHLEVLQRCLSGWKNVPVSDTEFLSFDKESIEYLDAAIITELANEVMGVVSPEESENLEEVSASQSGPEMKSGAAETA